MFPRAIIEIGFWPKIYLVKIAFYYGHYSRAATNKDFTVFTTYTVGPLLLRRLGHGEIDAINEVDAIFEGRTISKS